MSVTVWTNDTGVYECDWGVIEHPTPILDEVPPKVGPLVLFGNSRWMVEELAKSGPRPSNDIDGSVVSATIRDDRLFLHAQVGAERWTWELHEAHWKDGFGPLFVGRWPD